MRKSVVAVGNFDGVHLGHRDVLMQARALADKHEYDFTVLTFTPHPRNFFQPNVAPFRIAPDHVKKNMFDKHVKPDNYVVLDFNDGLQHMNAESFIEDVLVSQLNAAIVIVGDNFHFGYQRGGNIETLRHDNRFETIASELMKVDDTPISSTRIREHLKNTEINQANTLLGWEWYIQSEVVDGDKRGRELGYPTANMHFGTALVPAHGVYAVRVQIEEENEWRQGAANIGIRPMFETAMPMCETYIFDFEGDLYGKQVKIMPVQKIRDEMKFDDLDALITQIGKDCDIIRKILQKT